MATLTKFHDFAEQVAKEQHNFPTDTLKMALTNVLPNATQTTYDPVTLHDEPTNQNGYTPRGESVSYSWSESSGTATMTGTTADVVWTATAGGIGPFRYVVFFNEDNATDMLIGWYDYGSSITINDTETFTVKTNGNAILTIA